MRFTNVKAVNPTKFNVNTQDWSLEDKAFAGIVPKLGFRVGLNF